MRVATAREMRWMDETTIEKHGVPGLLLMEHAAECVADACRKTLKKLASNKILIVAGKGNNGGDGLAVARMLSHEGYAVSLLLLGNPEELKGDARTNWDMLQSFPVSYLMPASLNTALQSNPLVLDAILGTGLTREIIGEAHDAIYAINTYANFVLSVDIPSGIHADTGEVLGIAIKADETISFVLPKRGLLLHPGAEHTGNLTIGDIFMPKTVVEVIGTDCYTLTQEEASALLPKRPPRSNKGTFGRLLIVAGSQTMTGAAAFAAKGAYSVGAGLVTACVPASALDGVRPLVPEAVYVALAEKDGKVCADSLERLLPLLSNSHAVVAGCGLGSGEGVRTFIRSLLQTLTCPLVLDADGLNALDGEMHLLQAAKCPVIITPHPGEMQRLTGKSIEEILPRPIEVAQALAKESGVIVLLKDARTVIAHPDGRVYINTTGNAALAKGGTGDVLSGIIGGLLAQKMEPFSAAILGAYLHGYAGDLAKEAVGAYGVLAGELPHFASQACKLLVDAYASEM